MIVYDGDANWFKDIFHFWKSKTLLFLFIRVVMIGLLCWIGCYLLINHASVEEVISPVLFTWIGVALSILLVFRTNTAYDRWWEGRKHWGHLVNSSRSLAFLVDSRLSKDDVGNRSFFARYISNYAFALSAHLRGIDVLDKVIGMSEKELETLKSFYHKPNYIAKMLHNRVLDLRKQGRLGEFEELKLLDFLGEFNNVTGACERIKNTPIPFSYNTYLKIFILIYTTSLPIAYVNILGYYTIPLAMFEFFFLIGLEMMAEEIEDPFDNRENDLPTRTIATNIQHNVHEILDIADKVERPITPKLYEAIY